MANKQTPNPNASLDPKYPVVFIQSEDTIEIPAKNVTIDKVGEKAFGLSCLPETWTLPFIVVSDASIALR